MVHAGINKDTKAIDYNSQFFLFWQSYVNKTLDLTFENTMKLDKYFFPKLKNKGFPTKSN